MRLLHTADWHVGKAIRGRSRAEEHRAVLDEIVGIARARSIDVALVAGDLYDGATPSAEADDIVYRTLLDLAGVVQHVVVVAGNHDNPNRLAAVRPLLELTNVHVTPRIARPADGGILELEIHPGERVRAVLLPFVSQRGIVRAEDLMAHDADEHAQKFSDRLVQVVGKLCDNMPGDGVNILVGHAMVHGGVLGGGERSAHTIFDYSIPTTAFPSGLHYVALGHLHRTQELPAACPVHYCGSPLQLDFGEQLDTKSVKVIEARAGRPAKVEEVPLSRGRKLLTLRGSLDAVADRIAQRGDDYLRIELDERPRHGLADEVRELSPNVVDVRIANRTDGDGDKRNGPDPGQADPIALLDQYLKERKEGDTEPLKTLFKELLEADHEAEADRA
ncbi:MAG: exonuclease SbcCD subunit D [Acidobacteria bacterium]|nr:exonuclease SbcCD subunit D [Acidobacteriota bacterium]MYH29009.1 exonuclease SbcCD subunit D [Acidobacteriota bacterium]